MPGWSGIVESGTAVYRSNLRPARKLHSCTCALFPSYDNDGRQPQAVPETIKEKSIVWIIWKQSAVSAVRSVSYTHLDVYKRQGQHPRHGRGAYQPRLRGHCGAACTAGGAHHAQLGVNPVSYTHLRTPGWPAWRARYRRRWPALWNTSRPESISIITAFLPVSYTHLDVYKRQDLIIATITVLGMV